MIFNNTLKQLFILLILVNITFFDCYAGKHKRHKKIERAKEEVIAQKMHDDNNALICAICIEDENLRTSFKNVIRLNCHESHQFHADCLRGWTKITKNCPLCNKRIPHKKLEIEQDCFQKGEINKCTQVAVVLTAGLAYGCLLVWACPPTELCFTV